MQQASSGLQSLGERESRNSLKVSQSCGLKNDLLCSRPLRAQQPLVQQTSSGPAVTWRTVNELLRQSPLCQVGCATFPEDFTRPYRWVIRASATGLPEDFTCPVTLDGPVRLGARSLHSSCHTGQARTTGLRTNSQKPLLARSTGSCVVSETLSQLHELLAVSFPPLCSGIWRE